MSLASMLKDHVPILNLFSLPLRYFCAYGLTRNAHQGCLGV